MNISIQAECIFSVDFNNISDKYDYQQFLKYTCTRQAQTPIPYSNTGKYTEHSAELLLQ